MAEEIFEDIYKFNGIKDWQHQIIEAGNKFYEKYKLFPQFIRVKDEVMDLLFEEAERNYFNPLDSEHSVLDSEGDEIVPVRRDVSEADSEYAPADGFTVGRDAGVVNAEDDDFPIHVYPLDDEAGDEYEEEDEALDFDTDSDSPVILRSFGCRADGRVSFTTSKYQLFFIEGEDLEKDSFALNYGEDPDAEEDEEN